MKWMYRLVVALVTIALLIGLVYVSPYQYLIKGVRLTYFQGEKSAHFTDWYGFETRQVSNSQEGVIAIAENAHNTELSEPLLNMLTKTRSGSYLVFRNDTLICEKYFNGFTDTHRTNSFSMAKTVTTLMVQKSIELGYIDGWDVKVKSLLPWLQGEYAKELTLRHLTTMTSGLKWNENYLSPFGITAEAYYTYNIEGVMRSLPIEKKPGQKWQYQSGSTQLLSLALHEALKNPSKGLPAFEHISEFASEYIWQPLGMEAPARWSLDHEKGTELGFCCLNAVSRDFGRLGLWVLHHGTFESASLDSSFLAQAQLGYKDERYGHSFWISSKTEVPFTYFQGLGGQYIFMIPSKNMVVVRTGNGIVFDESLIFKDVKLYVAEAVRLFNK